MSRNVIFTGRLARASARNPRRVVALWGGLLVVSLAIIGTLLSGVLTTNQSFVGTPESQRAENALTAAIGTKPPVVETVIVKAAGARADTPAVRARVQGLARRIEALGPSVVRRVDVPAAGAPGSLSRDGTATLFTVTMTGDEARAESGVAKVLSLANDVDGTGGLTVRLAGQASIGHDTRALSESDLSVGEGIGIPVALVILVLVFAALVSALLPIGLAVVSILVSLALTALVGQVYELSFFVTNMITMMGLAVGIDYSLFIVSRYREERAAGATTLDAIERAGSTASRAVLFSGVTVVVALVGMLIVPTSIFVSLAVGAILVVFAAVAAALTLLPAGLALLGDRVEAGSVSRLVPRRARGAGFWPRAVGTVMRRPVVSLVATVALLAAAAIPYLEIHTGAAGVESLPTSLHARQGFDLLSQEFNVGGIAPAQIAVPDAASVPSRAALATLEQRLSADAVYGKPVLVPAHGGAAVLTVPINADATSATAISAVRNLRSLSPWPVGGRTSQNVDYFDIVDQYLPIVVGIVLALSFAVLLLAFRSLVVPLVAIAMNLLSVGAAYGLLVLVSQKGVGADLLGFQRVATVEAWIPLFLFSILFGLSMDYHVFLLSRIRERYDESGDTVDAVTFGITSSARLITGAALIMVAVFSGFAAGQMVMFQQMGFGLAVAVLLDATLVRTILVPATMRLLGRDNWYLPRALHWLPRIGIEGDAQPRTAHAQPGRRGTSTRRRNSQTTSSRWFQPTVSTVTTPRSGFDCDGRTSSTVDFA